jgi:hypothetical protein
LGSDCAARRSPPQGVLVVGRAVEETSNLLLALAHAARLGQAFAHCPLRVLGTITHQTLATRAPAGHIRTLKAPFSISQVAAG